MQTRKRTISDLPWFCQNQVYAWLPDYKAMRGLVVAQIREEEYYLTNNHIAHLRNRVACLQLECDDFENYILEQYYRDEEDRRNGANLDSDDEALQNSENDTGTYLEVTDHGVYRADMDLKCAQDCLWDAEMMGLQARGVDIHGRYSCSPE
jgi:hypothetical protein